MSTNGTKEHPILFSGPMIRAILKGRKTQTRRVLKVDTDAPVEEPYVLGYEPDGAWFSCATDGTASIVFCPYGREGDRLWVRETFVPMADLKTKDPGIYALQSRAFFRADHPTGLSHDDGEELRWRPSIFMPRALSRITLEITDVRVERLQEITSADIQADRLKGVLPVNYPNGTLHR